MSKIMKSIKSRCGIVGCNKFHYAKGYCQAHYNRVWQGRSVNVVMNPIIRKSIFKRPIRGTCTLKGCNRPHYANSLCQAHYHVARSVSTASGDNRKCSVKGCNFIHTAKNFCKFHYDLSRAQGKFVDIKNMSNYDEEAS